MQYLLSKEELERDYAPRIELDNAWKCYISRNRAIGCLWDAVKQSVSEEQYVSIGELMAKLLDAAEEKAAIEEQKKEQPIP